MCVLIPKGQLVLKDRYSGRLWLTPMTPLVKTLLTFAISAQLLLIARASAQTPVLQSINVTPSNPSLPKGLTLQFTATGNYSDGSTSDLTSSVTWASSVPTIASITAGGLATGLAEGTTTISANLNTTIGSTILT